MKDFIGKFKLDRLVGGKLPSAGQLVLASWRLYVDNFRSLARLSFLTVLAVPFITVAALVEPGPVATALTVMSGALFVALNAFVRPALICQIDANIEKTTLTGQRCLARSKKVFWWYLLTVAILGLVITAGYALWVLPGLVAIVFLAFTEQALVLEGKRGLAPFRRSIDLSIGNFLALVWRIAVFGLLFGLADFSVSVLLVKFPLWFFPIAYAGFPQSFWWYYVPLVTMVISALFTPLFLAAQTLLYVYCKKLPSGSR